MINRYAIRSLEDLLENLVTNQNDRLTMLKRIKAETLITRIRILTRMAISAHQDARIGFCIDISARNEHANTLSAHIVGQTF
jgi:hypothetical protein